MPGAHSRGILLAFVAYAAWGFLSPVGQILLDSMGPFTANAIRTLASLPFLMLLMGRKTTKAALRATATDASGWILGAGFLTLTLVPYLASLKYLPATITTLTVYLTPLLVAGWMFVRHGTRPNRLLIPTVVATLAGGYLTISARGGVSLDRNGVLGLGLAILGVLGWAGYTIHLKHLTGRRDADELTLTAFLTSGVAFTIGAALIEGGQVDWSPALAKWLVIYVLFPSVISFFLYSRALHLVEATTVAVLLGVELVSTAIVSHFLTDEVFSTLKVLGLGVVLVAITAYLWDERRTQAKPGAASA